MFDLEANCSKIKGEYQYLETVEFPVVIIDTESNRVVSEFHTYIQPKMESLNEFTTELCGITEKMLEGAPNFK